MATARANIMPSANGIYKNDITQVYELAAKHNINVVFDEPQVEGSSYNRTCTVNIRVGEFTAVGRARNKKEAKARAATAILGRLKSLPLPQQAPPRNKKRESPINSTVLEPVSCPVNEQGLVQVFSEGMNPCCCLSELVQARRMRYPDYSLQDSRRLAWGWLFTMRVTVEGLSAVGTGPTKKAAKNNAAAKMLELLGVASPQYNPLLRYTHIPPPQVDQVKQVDQVEEELLLPEVMPLQSHMGMMEDRTVQESDPEQTSDEVEEEICESPDVILEEEIFIDSDGEEERIVYITSATTTAPVSSIQEPTEDLNEPATDEVKGQEEVSELTSKTNKEPETSTEAKPAAAEAGSTSETAITGPEVQDITESTVAKDTTGPEDFQLDSPSVPETSVLCETTVEQDVPSPQVDHIEEVGQNDVELLPPEVLSLLTEMGVIEDGMVPRSDPEPTTDQVYNHEVCESHDVNTDSETTEEEAPEVQTTSETTTGPETEDFNEIITDQVHDQEEVCESPHVITGEEIFIDLVKEKVVAEIETSENKITSPEADVLEDSTGPEVQLETTPALDSVSLKDESERPESPAGPETISLSEILFEMETTTGSGQGLCETKIQETDPETETSQPQTSSQEEVKSLANVNTGPEISREDEAPSVLKTISTKTKITTVIEISLSTSQVEVISPSDATTGPETSSQKAETLSEPQTTSQSQPTSPPLILDGPPVASFLIRALVRKLVQKTSVFKHVDQTEVVTILEEKTKDHIMVDKDVLISIKDMRRVAKTAAKGLLTEAKLQGETLRAQDAVFQETVVKNLNNSLNTVLYEPKKKKKKSGLSRFFSSVTRFFQRT